MKKRILYAEANYQAIVRRNGYLVDKTAYIENLEQIDNPVFLRPRRFGKSLLCMMLESYYSVLFKDQFDQLSSGKPGSAKIRRRFTIPFSYCIWIFLRWKPER